MKKIIVKLLPVLALLAALIVPAHPASAVGYYDYDWPYRKSATVTNGVASYTTKILVGESAGAAGEEVDLGGLCQSDFDDLRFTGADGITLLPYWIESLSGATPNQLATIWVKNDATPSATIYLYYGNASATAYSSGTATFPFFDDFSGDLSKWTYTGSSSVTISSGTMIVDSVAAVSDAKVYSNTTFDNTYAIRSRLKTAHAAATTSVEVEGFYVQSTLYGYHAMFDYSSGTYAGKDGNYSGSWSSLTSMTGWSADTYGISEIIRNGATSTIYKINDANPVTITTNLSTTAMNNVFRAYTADYSALVTVDWTLARKYTSTEPTIGNWTASSVSGSGGSLGMIMMGTMALNSTIESGLDAFSVTNNGNCPIDATIQGTDMVGGTAWTLSDTASPGADTYGMKAGLYGGSYNVIIKKNATYNTLFTNLDVGDTQQFGIQILTATSTTDGAVKKSTVTLNYTAH